MTHRHDPNEGQADSPAGPNAGPRLPLPYEGPTRGAAVASEAALEAIGGTRPIAMGFAVLLFFYAAVGGAVGLGWLAILIYRLINGPTPTPPFITVASVNLLFAPIALAGGLRALAYYRAAGWAYRRRNEDDLERASIALKRLWRWAGAAAIVVIAFPVCMVIAAVLTGEWPG